MSWCGGRDFHATYFRLAGGGGGIFVLLLACYYSRSYYPLEHQNLNVYSSAWVLESDQHIQCDCWLFAKRGMLVLFPHDRWYCFYFSGFASSYTVPSFTTKSMLASFLHIVAKVDDGLVFRSITWQIW